MTNFFWSCIVPETFLQGFQITLRHCFKKFLGVGFLGIVVKRLRTIMLHNPSRLHDTHLIRHELHHTEVMGNK